MRHPYGPRRPNPWPDRTNRPSRAQSLRALARVVDGQGERRTLVVVGRRAPRSSRQGERPAAAGSGGDHARRARSFETLESDGRHEHPRHFVAGGVGRSTSRGNRPHEGGPRSRRDVARVLDRRGSSCLPVDSLVPRCWGAVDVHSTSDHAIHLRRARSGEPVVPRNWRLGSGGRPGDEVARRYYPYLYGVRRRRVGCGSESPTNRPRHGVCAARPHPGAPVFPFGPPVFLVRPSLGRSLVERHRRRDGGKV